VKYGQSGACLLLTQSSECMQPIHQLKKTELVKKPSLKQQESESIVQIKLRDNHNPNPTSQEIANQAPMSTGHSRGVSSRHKTQINLEENPNPSQHRNQPLVLQDAYEETSAPVSCTVLPFTCRLQISERACTFEPS